MWSHGCRSSINIKNDPKLLGLGLMDQWTSGEKLKSKQLENLKDECSM